jgi:hypothetical protein
MPRPFTALLTALALALCATALLSVGDAAYAHPEDEFCADGTGLDPALCRELAKLDRASGPASELPPVDVDRPVIETIWLYIKLGFIHILPKGYDHILFVLALFLASTRMRALLLQVFAFTVAHTITLGFAAAGWISAPANIVEPLIALSIAFVAVENIFFRDLTRWRPLVVFGFGLFHGIGFASVLTELGMARGQFLTSLISFNVGVEFGQLAVIALAFIAGLGIRRFLPAPVDANWRTYVVVPGSLLIGLMGLFWFVSRVLG